jgi:hypothetical protein
MPGLALPAIKLASTSTAKSLRRSNERKENCADIQSKSCASEI